MNESRPIRINFQHSPITMHNKHVHAKEDAAVSSIIPESRHVGPRTTSTTRQNSSHRQRMKFNSTREAILSMCVVHSPTCSTHDSRAAYVRQWLQHHVTINCSKYRHRLPISLLCCGYMWNKIISKIISVFYFTCNHVTSRNNFTVYLVLLLYIVHIVAFVNCV